MRLPDALAVLVLSFAASAQNVIVVQGGGDALQAAVNAAPAGATLDVMPGGYNPVSCSRGLRFRLRPGAHLWSAVTGTPAFRLTGLPANETCVVQGGGILRASLLNCAGSVVFDGVQLGGPPLGGSWIDGCTGPVVWQDCGGAPGQIHAVTVNVSSQVSFLRVHTILIDSWHSSLNLVDVFCWPDSTGYGGLRILGGRVSVSGGHFEAGFSPGSLIGNPGIHVMLGGHLVITGGAVVRRLERISQAPAPASPIQASAGSVWIDPSVSSVGAGVPRVGGTGTVTEKSIPGLTALHVPQTNSYRLEITAEPGTLLFTLVGLPVLPWSLPFGDAWLAPTSSMPMVNVMPPSGTASYTGILNGISPFRSLVAQSVAVTPANDIVIGVPVRFSWN